MGLLLGGPMVVTIALLALLASAPAPVSGAPETAPAPEAASAPEAAAGGPADARVVAAEGEVFVFPHDSPDEGAPADPEEATPLEAGDRVRTGSDSRAEIGIEGDSIFELGPNSEFTVTSAEPKDQSFTLDLGSLIAKIKTLLPGSLLRIHTPTAVAAVRGTEFGVDVADDASATRIAVFDEGRVAVSSDRGEGETMLEKNRETSVRRGERSFKIGKLMHFLKQRERLQRLRTRLGDLRGRWKPMAFAQRQQLRQALRQRFQGLPPEKRQQLQERMRQMHQRRLRQKDERKERRDGQRQLKQKAQEQRREQQRQKLEKAKEQLRRRNDERKERNDKERQRRKPERPPRREKPGGRR